MQWSSYGLGPLSEEHGKPRERFQGMSNISSFAFFNDYSDYRVEDGLESGKKGCGRPARRIAGIQESDVNVLPHSSALTE